jgi:NIMA (never in mitosis gene a)-related kinase
MPLFFRGVILSSLLCRRQLHQRFQLSSLVARESESFLPMVVKKSDKDKLAAPTQLSDFKIVKPLGKGSFGEVCKVTRKSDGLDYAMKSVDCSSADKDLIDSTLNEVRFLASIRHPNVVGFLEAFLNKRSKGTGYELCIVMEYAGGGDLSQKIERYRQRRQRMDERTVWDIFIQLSEGIQCLHSRGVIHRDLKAANCEY